MYEILVKIFLLSFLLNFLWEVHHCVLYTTCLKMKLKDVVKLLTIMSLKDGLWILVFYGITVIIFQNWIITQNYYQLGLFVLLSLMFSFVDEKISLAKKRWGYSSKMPLFFGVGITPLLELAVTGIITFFVIFLNLNL